MRLLLAVLTVALLAGCVGEAPLSDYTVRPVHAPAGYHFADAAWLEARGSTPMDGNPGPMATVPGKEQLGVDIEEAYGSVLVKDGSNATIESYAIRVRGDAAQAQEAAQQICASPRGQWVAFQKGQVQGLVLWTDPAVEGEAVRLAKDLIVRTKSELLCCPSPPEAGTLCAELQRRR